MSRKKPLELSTVLLYVALVIATIIVGFPLLITLAQSLMTTKEVVSYPPNILPTAPTLDNYTSLLTRPELQLPRWLFNSILVSSINTALVLVVASMAAFAFARLHFKGRDVLFFILLVTLMIPGQVTLIPNFLLMKDFKLLDTYGSLIWINIPNVFAVFLLRQFFMSVPRELEEAAILDGASYWGVYRHVILPLATSALIALGIFVFLGNYNDLFWPLIATNSLEMRTLPVGLTVLNGAYPGNSQRPLILAGAVFASIPVLLFYILFQRRIIKGITLTGMGGM